MKYHYAVLDYVWKYVSLLVIVTLFKSSIDFFYWAGPHLRKWLKELQRGLIFLILGHMLAIWLDPQPVFTKVLEVLLRLLKGEGTSQGSSAIIM